VSELTKEDIHKIVGCYLNEVLEEDEELRVISDPVPHEVIQAQREEYEATKALLKSAVGRSDHGLMEGIADRLLKERGVKLEKNSYDYKMLCRELLNASVKIVEVLDDRESGNYDYETVAPVVAPMVTYDYETVPPVVTPMVVAPKEEEKGEPLQQVIDSYVSEKKNKVQKRTIEKSLGYLKVFTFYFGEDFPISDIDYKEMRGYKEFLKRLPTGFTKTKKFEKWTVEDVLNNSDPNVGTLSEKSVNHYLGEIISFFNYAVRHGYMEKNFAEGLKIPISKAPNEQREVFTTDDLNKIFSSKEYQTKSHKSPYQYWLPVLALFTGCRLEELCQLHIADVKEVDGIWCLDITTEGSTESNPKRLKNKSAERLVPLHPFIVEDLKFLEYVDQIKEQGEERVFPDIPFSESEDKWGAIPSKWFGREKGKWGIIAEPRQKDWHAFRHTVVDNLAQQLVPEPVIKSFVGHAKEGETLGRYAKKLNVRKVYEEAVLKLDFKQLDFHALVKK